MRQQGSAMNNKEASPSGKGARIVVIGLPGSGKSLQARKIAEALDLVHISSGDLLRRIAESDTEMGRKVKAELGTGKLLSDETVCMVVLNSLPQEGFVLDGYPRRIQQAETLGSVSAVVYLQVPADECVVRILGRHQGRIDDNEEMVRTRIKTFMDETTPIITYYKNMGVLIEVSGSESPEEVSTTVKKKLAQKLGFE